MCAKVRSALLRNWLVGFNAGMSIKPGNKAASSVADLFFIIAINMNNVLQSIQRKLNLWHFETITLILQNGFAILM